MWAIREHLKCKAAFEACNHLEVFRNVVVSAHLGNPIAQTTVGNCFLRGYPAGHIDACSAALWFKSAAQQEYATLSPFNLANLYSTGRGVAHNDVEAVRWYLKAAEHGSEEGHAEAQFNLGFHFEEGRGVVKSDVEASRWYRKAADKGVVGAQVNLAILYRTGRGVAQSDVEATKWFLKAAEARAMLKLKTLSGE